MRFGGLGQNATGVEERASTTPDVGELTDQFNDCVENRTTDVQSRIQTNLDTRLCRWPCQSSDGRKWTADSKGKKIFPWPGASDARVPLIDDFINKDSAMLMVSWRRMKTLVRPTESNDATLASRLTSLLRWMKYTQMREAEREARLLANYILERGAAVMGIFWDRREQLGYETVALSDLADTNSMARLYVARGIEPPVDIIANLPALVLDPSAEDVVLPIVETLLPHITRESRRRQILRDLRTEGQARFPMPYMVRNRPTLTAFALNQDIFLPPESSSFDTARCVFWVEKVSETTLRERIRRGWNEGWVEDVIDKTRGVQATTVDVYARHRTGLLTEEKTFEIVHAYRRLYDADDVPGIYYTVFSPHLQRQKQTGTVGTHELLNYDHGEYPFVLVEREVMSREPDDSRGYGEVGSTQQRQVKVQWDARVDRTSLATLPPGFGPPGRTPASWTPGEIIETVRPESYGFLATPKPDIGSVEIEATVRMFAERYFGRPTNENDKVDAQISRQNLADVWFSGWAQIDTQILKLMQQFMPEQFSYRVMGSQAPVPVRTTRDDIQGQFDVWCGFSVADYDLEYVTQRMGLVEKLLQMDAAGVVDRAEALHIAAEMIDPNVGDRILRPAEQASAAEVDDEQTVFSKMLSGVQVDVKPGQAYGLRKQVLEGLVAKNPTAQRVLSQDENVRAIIENRMKQLDQQVAQQQNKLIGVYGAQPAQQGPNMLQLAAQRKPAQ